jgi:hypothetical protein
MSADTNYREPIFHRYGEPEERYVTKGAVQAIKQQGVMQLCEEQEKNINVLMEVVSTLEQRLGPMVISHPEPSNRNMSTTEGDYNNNSTVVANMIAHQAMIRRIIDRVASLRDNVQI